MEVEGEPRNNRIAEGADNLGDPVPTEVSYQSLKKIDWRLPNGNVEEHEYCYMCQFPAKDAYSVEYKALQSLLEMDDKDLKRRCTWAASHYHEHVYPYTGKAMTEVTFSNHVRFHNIRPKEVITDLLRDSRSLYDQAMREAMVQTDNGETHLVDGDKLKNIVSLQDQIMKQTMCLTRMK